MTRRSHFPAILTWLVLFFFYVPEPLRLKELTTSRMMGT